MKEGKLKIGVYWIMIIALLAILLISILISVSLGALNINISDTYKVIIGKAFNIESIYSDVSKTISSVIWNIRVPRVLLAVVAGAGLALCGCVMQSSVNNPISEPYILGVSSGATLGATLIIEYYDVLVPPIHSF